VVIGGVRTKCHLFVLWLAHSGKAVAKVVQGPGRARNENARWVLFRSDYLFDSFYCQPGIEGAHEKGGVEGAVRMGILPRGRPLTLARHLAAGRSPQPICSASSTMIPSGPRT
jgi:hypothetical protein